MACTVNPNDPFDTFLRCWCQRYSGDPDSKRQRAYYWAWQASNWYGTLQYLAQHSRPLTLDDWVDLDPTPLSAEEAQVSAWDWEHDLDPRFLPWLSYEPLCPLRSSPPPPAPLSSPAMEQYDDGSLLEALGEILNLPTLTLPVNDSRHLQAFHCPICMAEQGTAAVANLMQKTLLEFLHDRGVKSGFDTEFKDVESVLAEFQDQYRDLSTWPNLAWVSQLAAAIPDLPFSQVVEAIQRFVQQLTEEDEGWVPLSRGPVIRGQCSHEYHSQCVIAWRNIQEAKPDALEDQIRFVPLPGLYQENPQELKPFQCPMCRQLNTAITMPGTHPKPIDLQPYRIDSIQREQPEWGPYRLRPGALVWVYPSKRIFGGPHAGYLGQLKSFVPHDGQPECAFGGCFRVQILIPAGVGTHNYPISAVYDLSFLELNALPTRHQVNDLFAWPLGDMDNDPNYARFPSDALGYGDVRQNWVGVLPEFTARASQQNDLATLLQTLEMPVWKNLWKRIQEHQHRTESSLVQQLARPRLSWPAYQRKILQHLGLFQHQPSPSPRLHLPLMDQKGFAEQFTDVITDPALADMRIILEEMLHFIQFARSGYDFLPDYSARLLPVVRQHFRDVPAELLSLDTGPIELLPELPLDDEQKAPPRSRKRKDTSSSSASSSSSSSAAPPLPLPLPRPPRPAKIRKASVKKAKPPKVNTVTVNVQNIIELSSQVAFLKMSTERVMRAISDLKNQWLQLGFSMVDTPFQHLPEPIRAQIVSQLVEQMLR